MEDENATFCKMQADARYRVLLAKHGVEFTGQGAVIDARYKSSGDWYAKTDEGWWWHSGREGWKFCPMGPLGDPGGPL